MPKVTETCEKYNCSLAPNHDGWHVKKAAKGKIIISWLNGEWKTPDGQTGTYYYEEGGAFNGQATEEQGTDEGGHGPSIEAGSERAEAVEQEVVPA